MKFLVLLLVASMAGAAASPALAVSFLAGDLQDLPHEKYLTWGINWKPSQGTEIASASLTFYAIANWEREANDRLWLHLLQGAPRGVYAGTDNEAYGSWFSTPAYSGENVLLHEYTDLPEGYAERRDITYVFSAQEIMTFRSYASDGNFGLGFDPDCHYYNTGVKLTVETRDIPVRAVPEPGTLVLLGIGLAGACALRRRRPAKR